MSTSLLTKMYAGPINKELFLDRPIVVIDRPAINVPNGLRTIGEALGSLIVQNGYNEKIFLNGLRFDMELRRASISGNLGHYRWLLDNAFGQQGDVLLEVPPDDVYGSMQETAQFTKSSDSELLVPAMQVAIERHLTLVA